MSLERLWAGWRSEWVGSAGAEVPEGECLFCGLATAPPDEALVVTKGPRTLVVLNAYPYTSGHLLVAPLRHEADLERLDRDEATELMRGDAGGGRGRKRAYAPDAINVGMNLGRAAGAGIPGHLHVHVVPRWSGDTNFMTSVAETRVLPESLSRDARAGPRRLGRVASARCQRPRTRSQRIWTSPRTSGRTSSPTSAVVASPARSRRCVGAGSLLGGLASGNDGLLVAAGLLFAVAAYHFVAGWHLAVDQTEALAAASRAVGFPVGHASAQLGWRGLRSRPSWRVLLYSADAPPSHARARRGGRRRRRRSSASTPSRTPRTGVISSARRMRAPGVDCG